MVNVGPLTAEIDPIVLGHLCKFQLVSRLGSVTARQSSIGRQPNFTALNRGRHLYSAGRPSRWALAHISSIAVIQRLLCCFSSFHRNLRCQLRIQIHLQFFASLLLSNVASLLWYMLVHYDLLTNDVMASTSNDVMASTVIVRNQVNRSTYRSATNKSQIPLR